MQPRLKAQILILAVIPLLEIGLFFIFASQFGTFEAFLGLLLLFMLGIVVLRRVGSDSIKRLVMRIQKGGQLNTAMLDAAMIFASGILLILPGFLTGFCGLFVLIPWVRDGIATKLLERGAMFSYGQNGTILDGEYDYIADNDEIEK